MYGRGVGTRHGRVEFVSGKKGRGMSGKDGRLSGVG